jgi:hypothetical protein
MDRQYKYYDSCLTEILTTLDVIEYMTKELFQGSEYSLKSSVKAARLCSSFVNETTIQSTIKLGIWNLR